MVPVAGGVVRQEAEEDADDLPNAGMDTPVKVRTACFHDMQFVVVKLHDLELSLNLAFFVKVYYTEGTPAGGLSAAYSAASSIGGDSEAEDAIVDVDAAIASPDVVQVLDEEEEHGEEEAASQNGGDVPDGGAALKNNADREQAQELHRRQQPPSTSGQRMLAAKSVTFNPSDQTPLMFSRASSYDSLNSFDQGRYSIQSISKLPSLF